GMTLKQPTENIELTTLPNGVRVVSENVPYVQSASVGIFVGVGSRDEEERVRGISHFIEHMLFKGTAKRTAREIADEVESRGGHLNAYTDKESTTYQARVLAEHTPLAIDILTDMLLASLYDPEEMEREKRVVIEEIKMYEDTPEEMVHELFEETLWQSHPLGKSIIGTEETVSGLSRDDLLAHIARRYRPDRIVVSGAGNLDHSELVELADRALGGLTGSAPARELRRPQPSGKSAGKERRDIEQTHFCFGNAGYSKHDPERFALSILNNVLGGNMSSRLFQEIREKRGLAYAIGSYGRSYQDGGHFCVYGGTSPDTYEQVLDLTRKEFAKVRAEGLSEDELTKAKTQVRGALVLGLENMNARMNRYGDSLLAYGRVIPISEILSEYEAVTHDKIAAVAAKALDDSALTVTTVGPAPE
ncbi:MAG TPA: pitrilysin family protein, partial [Chthonomonadaceae bacterium]|nr:pitrilysin family protein [Chthonomonadaceae bacterium]